ncbi:hypothetical protein [Microvirga splendida]|uniref:FtsX-like permease family protein n=1 Tax=Microvirga splendida TaxID=2795727 RepID=A0ABS0Y7N8_9HYPH|nr:hypothetical protein [Microvirga splendida]MBJ6128311.1 hypothetical protein [Microvirga splendida]
MNEPSKRDNQALTIHATDDNVVVLPCEPSQFRDFISGLLGRPQTIERIVRGPFEVRKSDIENLHHLISQRLTSQNDATFMSFQARVIYDDDSSVSLNSIEEFVSYAEVKPLLSQAVHVSWIYLLKFPSKSAPEKQEISISFQGGHSPFELEIGSISPMTRVYRSAPGTMRVRINHTDRTWGSDIDALIAGHLGTLVQSESGIRKFASEYSGWIGFLFSALIILASLSGVYSITSKLVDEYLEKAQTIASVGSESFAVLQQKIDFLIDIVASGMWTKYAFYTTGFLIISLVAAIFIGMFIGSMADIKRGSFVLLTVKAEKHRESSLRKLERNWLTFCGSVIGAIIIGI